MLLHYLSLDGISYNLPAVEIVPYFGFEEFVLEHLSQVKLLRNAHFVKQRQQIGEGLEEEQVQVAAVHDQLEVVFVLA